MDIGEPPSNSYDDLPSNDPHHVGHTHLNLPAFSAAYPLPFRVLTLIGLEILLWAINLHVLTSLGIDAAGALDLTDEHPDALILDQADRAEGGEEKVLFDEIDENHRSSVDGSNPQASRIIRLDSPSPTSTNIHLHPRAHSLPHVGSSTSSIDNSNTPFSRRRPLRRRTDLHQPIYSVFTLYSLWVGLGWVAFRYASGGSAEDMDGARWIIGVIVVGLGVGMTWRKTGFFARSERMGLLSSFKRILSPPWDHAPFFADVILADVLTSFAKVLGDLVISGNQIWGGGLAEGRVRITGVGSYIKLAMVSLPYCLRLRQCLQEYRIPTQSSSRPLYNALKYASAFPVIYFSAVQRNVVKEVASLKGVSVETLEEQLSANRGRWFGESRTFRLWLLAVLVNSLFSFWWDVSNDWGLSMLQSDTWFRAPASSSAVYNRHAADGRFTIVYRNFRRLVSSVAASLGIGSESSVEAEEFELGPHRRSPYPSPPLTSEGTFPGPSSVGEDDPSRTHTRSQSNGYLSHSTALPTPSGPFGLRPRLLFPDPFVYYLFILLDLVLRFTWSLKLSSHLHTISEIESGVFIMEALELGRRWMWVFLRVEWEEVKRKDARAKEAQHARSGGNDVRSTLHPLNGSAPNHGLGLTSLDIQDRKIPIIR